MNNRQRCAYGANAQSRIRARQCAQTELKLQDAFLPNVSDFFSDFAFFYIFCTRISAAHTTVLRVFAAPPPCLLKTGSEVT